MWFYDISVRGESKRCDFNPFFFLKLKKTDLQMSAKRKFITTVYVSSFEIFKKIYYQKKKKPIQTMKLRF